MLENSELLEKRHFQIHCPLCFCLEHRIIRLESEQKPFCQRSSVISDTICNFN